MKRKVYIETSVPSAHCSTRTDPTSVHRRHVTQQWWEVTNDPLIDEIHEIRRKIFLEECEGDPRKLFLWAIERQAQHPERVVGYDRAGKAVPAASQGVLSEETRS